MLDFEKASRNAISKVFPESPILVVISIMLRRYGKKQKK